MVKPPGDDFYIIPYEATMCAINKAERRTLNVQRRTSNKVCYLILRFGRGTQSPYSISGVHFLPHAFGCHPRGGGDPAVFQIGYGQR